MSTQVAEKEPALQSIFLEGSIGHESNILVKDAETKTDEILNDEDDQMVGTKLSYVMSPPIVDRTLSGSNYEGINSFQVVLSSKMTLSLINVDADSASN